MNALSNTLEYICMDCGHEESLPFSTDVPVCCDEYMYLREIKKERFIHTIRESGA